MTVYHLPRERFNGIVVWRVYRDPKPLLVYLASADYKTIDAEWNEPYRAWLADHIGYVPAIRAWFEDITLDGHQHTTEIAVADFRSDADLVAFQLSIADE